MLDLAGWPEGMRVIVRKERPHPGRPGRNFTHLGQHGLCPLATGRRKQPGRAPQ
jgi:hypothetical protein